MERVVVDSVSTAVIDEKEAVELEKPIGWLTVGAAEELMVPLPAAVALALAEAEGEAEPDWEPPPE